MSDSYTEKKWKCLPISALNKQRLSWNCRKLTTVKYIFVNQVACSFEQSNIIAVETSKSFKMFSQMISDIL